MVGSEVIVALFVILAVFAISISWMLSQRQHVISGRNDERDRHVQATEQAMKKVKVGLYQDKTDMDAAVTAKMEELRSTNE